MTYQKSFTTALELYFISLIIGVVLFFGARSLYPPRAPGEICFDWCPPWGNTDERVAGAISIFGPLIGAGLCIASVVLWVLWLFSRTPTKRRRAIRITVLGIVILVGSVILGQFVLFAGILGLCIIVGFLLMTLGVVAGIIETLRYWRVTRFQKTET